MGKIGLWLTMTVFVCAGCGKVMDYSLEKVLLYQGSSGTKLHRDAKCASGPYGGRVWTRIFTIKEARNLAKNYVRPCKRCAGDLYNDSHYCPNCGRD